MTTVQFNEVQLSMVQLYRMILMSHPHEWVGLNVKSWLDK